MNQFIAVRHWIGEMRDETEHPARKTLARALVAGAGLGAAFAAYRLIALLAAGETIDRNALLEPAAMGVAAALGMAPLTVVELACAARRPSLARDAVAFLAGGLVVLVACFPATVEYAYTMGLVQGGTWAAASQSVLRTFDLLRENPRTYGLVFTGGALIASAATILRLRGLGLARQTLALVAVAAFVVQPLLALERKGRLAMDVMGALMVLAAVVVPAAFALADLGEGRLLARLRGDEPEPFPRPRLALRTRTQSGRFAPCWRLRASSLGRKLPALGRSGRPWLAVLLLAGGGLAVGAHALENPRDARWKPSPHAPALAPSFAAWEAGSLGKGEVAALVSRAFAIEHRARRELGAGDPLCIEEGVQLACPSAWCLTTDVSVQVDGGPPLVAGRSVWTCALDWVSLEKVKPLALPRSLPPLEPGWHEVACTTSLTFAGGGAGSFSTVIEETLRVHVVPGAEPVALVRAPLDGSSVLVYAPTGTPGWLTIELVDPPVAVAGTVEVTDEAGHVIASDTVVFPAETTTDWNLWLAPKPSCLPDELATLTLTITPDPRVAIARSATVRAIHDQPLVRRFALGR